MTNTNSRRDRAWLIAALALAFSTLNPSAGRALSEDPGTVPTIAGTWVATLSHGGETRRIALIFEARDAGGFLVKLRNPAIHIFDVPIAQATVTASQLRIGHSLVFDYDPVAGTLSGSMPRALVPVYPMPAVFHRGTLEREPRPEIAAKSASPVWVFDAGAEVWSDVAYEGGALYAGGDDGILHALEPRSGKELWTFRTGGPIRARVTTAEGHLFVHADDGFLYKIAAATGALAFRARVDEEPKERLPLGHERSRYDTTASAAAVDQGCVYLGTHSGHVLALSAADGRRLWDFTAGDSVVSSPVVDGGRVYFGSFDGYVYGLDAASGVLVWKHDTGAPVISRPAVHEGRVIVGSRSYDLLALAGATGTPIWTRYIWFSWVESPATIRDGTAYVGSSDAARLFAFDARTGQSVWDTDVHGWAWGQPAVTDARVFIGTSGTSPYLVEHDSALLAVDRATGRTLWRFPLPRPRGDTTYGFAGSPAVGDGLVFAGAIDGKIYAFAQ